MSSTEENLEVRREYLNHEVKRVLTHMRGDFEVHISGGNSLEAYYSNPVVQFNITQLFTLLRRQEEADKAMQGINARKIARQLFNESEKIDKQPVEDEDEQQKLHVTKFQDGDFMETALCGAKWVSWMEVDPTREFKRCLECQSLMEEPEAYDQMFDKFDLKINKSK